MKSRIGMIFGLLLTPLVMFAPATHAQTDGGPPSGARSQWRAIRQERKAACVNKAAGTQCSFSREGQMVSGICRATRRGKLACHTGKGERGHGMHGSMGGGMPYGNAPPQ